MKDELLNMYQLILGEYYKLEWNKTRPTTEIAKVIRITRKKIKLKIIHTHGTMLLNEPYRLMEFIYNERYRVKITKL